MNSGGRLALSAARLATTSRDRYNRRATVTFTTQLLPTKAVGSLPLVDRYERRFLQLLRKQSGTATAGLTEVEIRRAVLAFRWLMTAPPHRPRNDIDSSYREITDQNWFDCGFTWTERDCWIAEGIPRHAAQRASELRDAGFVPGALGLIVDGRLVLEWVQDGEPAWKIRERLERQSA
jgi:hypothetical protein